MVTLPALDIKVQADRAAGYRIQIAPGLFRSPLADLPAPQGRVLLVTTPTVFNLYGASVREKLERCGADVTTLVMALSENGKRMDAVLEICREAAARGLGRDDTIVGLGGGVCTDLVTMAASLLRRGVPHIRIPTTLIGQIDAAIGIKGAVNVESKNNLGCFYPPSAVFIDPDFLTSLPWRELQGGLAEIVKIAMMKDLDLFELVERGWPAFQSHAGPKASPMVAEIICRSVAVMMDELSRNLWENQGRARLCDFGHTFSPAIEAGTGYRLRHGEAVAIDMAVSALLGRRLGLTPGPAASRLLALLRDIGLPTTDDCVTEALCASALDEAARHRGGKPNLVVPVAVGDGAFVGRRADIAAEDIAAVLDELTAQAQPAAVNELHAA